MTNHRARSGFFIRAASVLALLSLLLLPALAQEPSPDQVVWGMIKDSSDVGTLTRFVEGFPDSPLVAEAQAKIAALNDEGAAFDAPAPEPVPEPGKRFALYPGLDYYGNDIRPFSHTSDAATCAQSCLANGQCVAFTFNTKTQEGPNCFLKSDVGYINAYSNAFSGLLLDTDADAPTYRFNSIDPTLGLDRGYAYDGSAFYSFGTNLDGCIVACNQESMCGAFTFDGNQCLMKEAAGSSYSASRNTSGYKRSYNITPARILTLDE